MLPQMLRNGFRIGLFMKVIEPLLVQRLFVAGVDIGNILQLRYLSFEPTLNGDRHQYYEDGVNVIMTKCEVYIDGISDKYAAQYEIEDNTVVVEIFNYTDTWLDSAKTGSKVTYKGIKLLDFSNKKYIYSQIFYNCGWSFGLVY